MSGSDQRSWPLLSSPGAAKTGRTCLAMNSMAGPLSLGHLLTAGAPSSVVLPTDAHTPTSAGPLDGSSMVGGKWSQRLRPVTPRALGGPVLSLGPGQVATKLWL